MRGMRVLGYQAAIPRHRRALSISASLASHFNELAKAFPNAKRILGDFQLSNAILDRLDSFQIEDKSYSIEVLPEQSADQFCSAIIADLMLIVECTPIDFNQHKSIGEIVAFFWLVHASVYALPSLKISLNLHNLMKVSQNLVFFIYGNLEHEPSVGNIPYLSLKDGDIVEWAESAARWIDEVSYPLGFQTSTIDDVPSAFAEACMRIRNINDELYGGISNPPIVSSQEPYKDSNNHTSQRGVELGERQRLIDHRDAFLESELKMLSGSIIKILDEENNISFRERSIITAYCIEATICALALATGRTIEAAIKFSIVSDSNEHISLTPQHWRAKGAINCVFWVRAIDSGASLNITLPEFLISVLRKNFVRPGAKTIEDCLPYSLSPWEDRCYNWIAGQLSGSKNQIRRKIRDTLARSLYKSSASSSLLNLLATAQNTIWRKQESLSHYINPLNERNFNEYADACERIFGKYGNKHLTINHAENSVSDSDFAVSVFEHQQISENLRSQIESYKESSNFIE